MMLFNLPTIVQVLEAGANAVAAVRSPKTSAGLLELQAKYPDALTVVAMDTGVFSSVKVRPRLHWKERAGFQWLPVIVDANIWPVRQPQASRRSTPGSKGLHQSSGQRRFISQTRALRLAGNRCSSMHRPAGFC